MKSIKNFFTKADNTMTDLVHSKYQCPMGCEGDKTYNEPGRCPVCNMNLVPSGDRDHDHHR